MLAVNVNDGQWLPDLVQFQGWKFDSKWSFTRLIMVKISNPAAVQ